MYRSFDEEVFLAPESIVAGVVASAAFDDEPEMPDPGPLGGFENAHPVGGDPDADGADASRDAVAAPGHVDETSPFCAEAEWLDRWARRALAANGFGG